MHAKRWITGLTVLPFLLLLIFKGSLLHFAIVVSIIAIIALREYFHIVLPAKSDGQGAGLIPYLAFITAPLIIWGSYRHSFQLIVTILTFNLMIAGIMAMARFGRDPAVLGTITKQLLGIVYIPLFLSYLVLLRSDSNGSHWVLFLLFIVFAGDIGALYMGILLGRHKLCPAVSPKKTIEGSIGGITANVIVGSAYKAIFFPELPWGACLVFFVLIGITGQIGDLFESIIKRSGNIKDSGTILPGHGGFMDRADAAMFAAPVAYYYKLFFF
jgi:phosphatidate cytidylyltransferase